MTDTPRVKVRALGSGRTHHADVPNHLVRSGAFRTLPPPIAALCGVVLGARGPATIVVMKDAAQVNCRACVTLAQSPRPPRQPATNDPEE